MKFIIGEHKATNEFDFDAYTELQEPSRSNLQFIAGILFLLLGVGCWLLWYVLGAFREMEFGIVPVLMVVLLGVLLIPIHELLHAAFYPFTDHKCVVLGFWPEMLAFYAAYKGELSRNRLLIVYVAPFVVISVFPLLLHWATGMTNSWLAVASVTNAAFSSADMIGVYLIASQTPATAAVTNNGWKTYWRIP